MNDSRFNGGHDYVTGKLIAPKIYRFSNYSFVTGYPNDSGNSTLGMYYENKEIYFEKTQDGTYDTVMKANFNNDGIPDFIVIYSYEDGADIYGIFSITNSTFSEKYLGSDVESSCVTEGDTMRHLQPLQIRDINNDGKDEIIVNLLKYDNTLLGFQCTDTIYPEKGEAIVR